MAYMWVIATKYGSLWLSHQIWHILGHCPQIWLNMAHCGSLCFIVCFSISQFYM